MARRRGETGRETKAHDGADPIKSYLGLFCKKDQILLVGRVGWRRTGGVMYSQKATLLSRLGNSTTNSENLAIGS